jgi:hypothetical protein
MGVLFNIFGIESRLATWNRPRTSSELRSYVESRHASLPDGISIE